MQTDWSFFIPVISVLVTCIAITVTLRQWKEKKVAQEELKVIKRRGNAPFFRTSEALNLQVYENLGAGQIVMHQYCLGGHYREFPKGAKSGEVILLVDNHGESARSISVKLDGEEIVFSTEPDFQGAHGHSFFRYPYEPQKHGQTQRIEICFETRNGVQDTHIYETKHGVSHLKRIDPA